VCAMLLPDAQRVVLEAGVQRRQSAEHAAINARLVDHDLLHFVSVMPRRRLHGAPPDRGSSPGFKYCRDTPFSDARDRLEWAAFGAFADMISPNGGKGNLTSGVVYAEFRACGFAGRHQWPAL